MRLFLLLFVLIWASCECPYQDELDRAQQRKSSTGDVFYADASLLYSLQSSNFFPFDDPELPATLVSRNLWKGTVTVGLRF